MLITLPPFASEIFFSAENQACGLEARALLGKSIGGQRNPLGDPLCFRRKVGVLIAKRARIYISGRNRRSLKELLTTDTELMAMAAEAIMGLRRIPQKG